MISCDSINSPNPVGDHGKPDNATSIKDVEPWSTDAGY